MVSVQVNGAFVRKESFETTIIADNTGDNVVIEATADTTNGALKLSAAGLHAVPIHWVAYIEMVETAAF